MLNTKKMLTKMLTIEDITPSTVADFITVNSGFTVSDLSVMKYGRLVSVNFVVKYNATWNANSTGTIGTIKDGYRPAVNSGGASATFRELFAADGRVFLRPATSIAANSGEAVAIMYLLA